MNLSRRLLTSGLALAALLASAVASADQGSVVLVSGQVLVGEVQQVATGEYIVIKLPTGEVKAIAWAQIGSFQIGASGSVSTGNPTAPTPPPTYTPPPPTYTTPPPPPPSYYNAPPPPPPPPPRPAFNPAFQLGAKLGSIAPSGTLSDSGDSSSFATSDVPMSNVSKAGWAFEGNVGIHFSPAWTFYGFWEYGAVGRGSANSNAADASTLNTLGLGLNATTSPRGPVGFLADISLGYRWFNFSQTTTVFNPQTLEATSATNRIIAEGFVPLRIALGMTISLTEKTRIDLAGQLSVGTFSRFKGAACPDGCDIDSAMRGTHVTTGLTAGIRWDL